MRLVVVDEGGPVSVDELGRVVVDWGSAGAVHLGVAVEHRNVGLPGRPGQLSKRRSASLLRKSLISSPGTW